MRKGIYFITIGLLLLTGFFSSNKLHAQQNKQGNRASQWADSVYQRLNMNERVGQLIFARANYSNKPYDTGLDSLITKYNLGGVTFFAGDPVKQALQTNHWNKLAKVPLFISMDAEWGLGMRLRHALKYPLQMTLGAFKDDSLLYEMGKEIGKQCSRMGIQINFAPVVDVNSNPKNPIIGMRSFGEEAQQVAEKAWQYTRGMQEEGILACAKHFPGHGNTYQDSHKTLPLVKDSKRKIKDIAIVPYQYLFKQNKPVASVMVAHLSIPALEKNPNIPSSLSFSIVSRLLKKKLGFKGLIITDGLDMKGVTQDSKPGELALKAFKAGNDILLIPDNIPKSIEKLKEAISKSKGLKYRLKESCTKILRYKYLSGLTNRKPIDIRNLEHDLNRPKYQNTINKMFSRAITVVRNQEGLIPLRDTASIKTAIVIVGDTHLTTFEKTFNKYFPSRTFHIPHKASLKDRRFVLKELKHFDLAIVCLVNTNISYPRQFGIDPIDWHFAQNAAKETRTILDVFASPYSLESLSNPEDFASILVSYQDKQQTQAASAEIISGARDAVGKLPASSPRFPRGTGIPIPQIRLRYGKPGDVGANSDTLKKIDSIAMAGIQLKAYPGCQILASKNGVIFYDKTFGYHTYAQKLPEKKSDIYDLASLTKVLATSLSLMKLVEEKKLNLDDKLSNYLLFLRGTNKQDLRFKEVLSHQAGLEGWIPFYKEVTTPNGPDPKIFHKKISEDYPVRVAENMYVKKNFQHRIYQEIIDSPLGKKTYKYSDLGFYLFKVMIEQMTNQAFDTYVYKHFYQPMGLKRLVFTPRKYFPLNQINPTQDDNVFRKQQLLGDVQDQGAALLGGVSGHAGLFGDAEDVASVMQMLMQGGHYEGQSILSKQVIDTFNHRWFEADSNRRGLVFDKPMLEYKDHLSNCKSVSDSSFGHTGFTGSYMWADPANGLVYVFLSNRVYPDMNNDIIIDKDIRTNIHQLFYNAFKGGVPKVR